MFGEDVEVELAFAEAPADVREGDAHDPENHEWSRMDTSSELRCRNAMAITGVDEFMRRGVGRFFGAFLFVNLCEPRLRFLVFFSSLCPERTWSDFASWSCHTRNAFLKRGVALEPFFFLVARESVIF